MSGSVIGHALHGHGPRRVLFLHGWFGDHKSFDPILPGFEEDVWSLALMDQRGYGLSGDRTGPFDIATIAEDALALADHLGWDNFSVVGHSMGGKAGLRLALLAPDRIAALVGIAPVWAGAAPFDADSLGLFRAAATDAGARDIIIRHSTSGRLDDGLYGELVETSQSTASVEAFAAYFESWALDNFADQVRGLSTPVQVLVGAFDQAITADLVDATWRDALCNFSCHVLADAGHYPMQENPAALGEALNKFLEAPIVQQGACLTE